jgi:CRISPR-associated endonuclease Csn1
MDILIESGLMPDNETERKRLEILNPYELRAKGTNGKISLHEFGRVLFHIDQRRGFKSNRKSDKSDKDEKGKIAEASKRLSEELNQRGFKTLGEYLYDVLKKGESVRVKMVEDKYNIYPLRSMYEKEFEVLWNEQTKYYSNLTEKLKLKIKDTIFFQRDLLPQEAGFCEFEEGEHRLAKAHPLFQDFRIEQEVNTLEVLSPQGEFLSEEQRNTIKQILKTCSIPPDKGRMEITFSKLKKAINLNKKVKFNLESEKRKGLKCHTSNYIMSGQGNFESAWYEKDDNERYEIIELLISDKKDNEIKEWLKNKFGFDDERAEKIMHAYLEEGFGSLSKKAIEKILPFLKQMMLYPAACKEAGYNHSDNRPDKTLKFLPYYGEVLKNKVIGGKNDPKFKDYPEKFYGKINNPSVHIALNQLRKVVNALIKKYGPLEEIALEMARDLKVGTKGLQEIEKEQSANQRENERIDSILEKQGLPINGENRLRYKLWEELAEKPQNRRCVFSGEQISMKDVWSDKFEIEHLLPFSRTYDDARSNKTLSSRKSNRLKGNKTPYEAFGNSTIWKEILERVEKLPDNKKWRFGKEAMEKYEKDGGAIARMLNDTRYMAKTAKEYLGYVCEPNNVYAIPGQLTAILRNVWGLNYLKDKDNPEAYRADHRHHSIDAFVIGCTTRGMFQLASKCSDWADKAGGQHEGRKKLFKRRFEPFESYEEKGRDDFKEIVEKMVISYKPDHKNVELAKGIHSTTGQLHQETAYGPTDIKPKDKGCVVVSLRRDIKKIEEKHLDEIADKEIAKDIAKILKTEDKTKKESMLEKYGIENKISKVKCFIEKDKKILIPVYKKDKDGKKEEKPYKYYVGGNNYCMDIYCLRPDDKRDPKNAGKWMGEVISNFDAHQSGFEPEWRKKHPTAKRIMRLFINDTIVLTFTKEETIPQGLRKFVLSKFDRSKKKEINIVFRIKKMTGKRVFIRPQLVAKENGDQLSWGPNASGLFERKGRRVSINELGEIHDPGFMPGWQNN